MTDVAISPPIRWTDEKFALLKEELLRTGDSFREIAERLKWRWHRPVTRNMLIGVCDRRGFKRPLAVPPPPRDILPETGECHWPIGHPNEPGFHFCRLTADRAPYCGKHRAKAYMRPKEEAML